MGHKCKDCGRPHKERPKDGLCSTCGGVVLPYIPRKADAQRRRVLA